MNVREPLLTEIVIVGAGPTGLSMAVQLVRYNIDFVILEKNEKTTHLSKAIAVQARTLEIFQELGLATEAIKQGRITTALNLFYHGKRKARINIANLGENISPFPFALSLEQSKTEKLLVDYLARHEKEILWKSTFDEVTQRDDGVDVKFHDDEGEQKIEAAYLIGCDGAASPIRHQLGLAFEGSTVPKLFYVADVTLKSSVINKDELFAFLIRKGFAIFFPMEGDGHYRLVGVIPDATEDASLQFADLEADLYKQIALPLTFNELRWFSSYKVHTRKAQSFRDKRCFLAGDSAHIHTPAGGQGMNTGIQDAYNLAWKIAFTLRGKIKPEILDTYNSERQENATRLLQTTDRMFDVASGKTWVLNFFRLTILPRVVRFITKNPSVRKRIFPLISQTAIQYSDTYLTVPGSIGIVKAGVRMPYFVLSNGRSIFDFLAEPDFKLLFFGYGKEQLQKNDLRIKLVQYTFSDVPDSIFHGETDFYILLRPDNHISYIGKDIKACVQLLDNVAMKRILKFH